MMYSEFAKAVGCKDNAHNHEVFRNLEVMYMNTEMTKEEIYEYGRKLVDNSKSEEQLKLEAEINAEIEFHKSEVTRYQGYVKDDQYQMNYWKEQGDEEMIAMYKRSINFYRGEIKMHKNKISALKWVLE